MSELMKNSDSSNTKPKDSNRAVELIPFTSREVDIISCLLHGRSAKKIAVLLSLSARTVENHIYNIMLKIECNSREGVIDYIERAGYLFLLREHYGRINPLAFIETQRPRKQTSNQLTRLITKEKRLWFLAVIGFFALVGYGSFLFYHPEKNTNQLIARSDFVLPAKHVFLERPDLLAQIKNEFKAQSINEIRTIALLGAGGSGKTTLARDYAYSQNLPVVWEINAETIESIKLSFENLAQAVAKTEADKKILRGIQDIKISEIRETKVIQFVKDHLRLYTPWFLIFDNVEKFSDIQKWFPQDTNTWGNGKILLTTRDSTIGNNMRVNHMILTGELTPYQKLSLFTKIMNHQTKQLLTTVPTEEVKTFLEDIPPFPLDVSVAAYYLKAANLPYAAYLENLKKHNKDFETVQEALLKEAGNYTKTRYGIIVLSLQNIITAHKDFRDLLLFISLLDSQDIPRALLESYKDKTIVDNFIYHLKKYSLITNESLHAAAENSTFSLHRSTQSIILAHLAQELDLKKDESKFQHIIDILEKYIFDVVHKEDVLKMSFMLSHCERVLKHDDFLTPLSRALIKGELGSIYFYLNHHKKAEALLQQAIRVLDENRKNPNKLAQFLSCLASVYIALGDGEKSIKYHTQSVATFQKYFPDNYLKIALHLTYLGNVYRDIGEYKKSKNILEQAHSIFKNKFLENHSGFARNLVDLGKVYRSLGYYEKARVLLEQGFVLYKKSLPKDHFRIAWAAIYLACTLNDLERYKEAQDLAETALQIYKKNFPDNHMRAAWLLASLGHTYEGLGQYKKAKELLQKSLENLSESPFEGAWVLARLGSVFLKLKDLENAKEFFEKSLVALESTYGKDHVETARVLKDLGYVHLMAGHIEIADDLINKAIKIFQNSNHPDLFFALENLAEVYVKKATLPMKEEGKKQSKDLKTQAIHCFEQALCLTKVYFLKDSPHIARIQTKLNSLRSTLR